MKRLPTDSPNLPEYERTVGCKPENITFDREAHLRVRGLIPVETPQPVPGAKKARVKTIGEVGETEPEVLVPVPTPRPAPRPRAPRVKEIRNVPEQEEATPEQEEAVDEHGTH